MARGGPLGADDLLFPPADGDPRPGAAVAPRAVTPRTRAGIPAPLWLLLGPGLGLGLLGCGRSSLPVPPESFADVAASGAEPAPAPVPPSEAVAFSVPVEMVEKIAQRVVAQISERAVREIAWEVIPDLGTVTFRDGGASGPVKIAVDTKASSTAPDYILVPGEGLLFQTSIYIVPSAVVSTMVIYG